MTSPGTPSPRSAAECLDRLEALLESGSSIFGRRSRLDEARRLITHLRTLVTQGAARAQQVQSEAEAVLRRAQDEARRIVLEAQERARGGVDAEVVRGAELEAQTLREEAARRPRTCGARRISTRSRSLSASTPRYRACCPRSSAAKRSWETATARARARRPAALTMRKWRPYNEPVCPGATPGHAA